jgi:hypothetical protein
VEKACTSGLFPCLTRREIESQKVRGAAPFHIKIARKPNCWKGTLAQYVGRLHRDYQGKNEVIVYDYVDADVSVLARMASKRQTGYHSLGYSVRPFMPAYDPFPP